MQPAGFVFGAVFAYGVLCNLFPQGRSAKMVHLSLSGGFFLSFFFFFLRRNQSNPHTERKIVSCSLLPYLAGAFELHDVSAEGLDSGLCKSPGASPSAASFRCSLGWGWVAADYGMSGSGLALLPGGSGRLPATVQRLCLFSA